MNWRVIALAVMMCPLFALAQIQGYEVPREQQVSLEEKARRGDQLKGYRITPNTGIPERVNLLDTVAMGSHNYLSPERRSLGVAYTGNSNTPWQSKVFFDRDVRPHDFVYLSGYKGMMYTPENVLFYNTKTPLTLVHYRKNFGDDVLEELLNGTLSFNLGKRINLGVSGDYSSARGYYSNSKSRNVDYRIWGSYTSDRYDLWAYVANDYYKHQENGGISDLSYITNPDKYSNGRVKISSLDIPVRLSSPLFNRLRHGHGYLSHRYKLGYYKSRSATNEGAKGSLPKDSLTFVPVGSITHQIHYSHASRRMIAPNADDLWLTVFGTPTANTTTTTDISTGTVTTTVRPNDVSGLKTLKNTLSLSLLEGFRPWVKAGLSAYIRTEHYWFSNPASPTDASQKVSKMFSAFVGGELARYAGDGLNFRTKGELGLAGSDLGSILLEGDIRTKFNLWGYQFGLKGDAHLSNLRPPYFAAHHHGTFGWWDEDFSFSRRIEFGARVDLTSLGGWAELRAATLQNYIYWNNLGKAVQHSPLIQMNMLRLGYKKHLGFMGWQVEGAYQIGTNEAIIPLPMLTLRGDLFVDFMIAKVLQVQIGVEGYWNSSYYAPYYHPSVMQFVNQIERRVGGESPLVNVYANFRMRTNRFYIRMYNAGEALLSPSRESMYRYVYNPMHLEAGIVIDLKN